MQYHATTVGRVLICLLCGALAPGAVPPPTALPAARVADAVTNGEAFLWLDPAWPGWRAPGLRLEWRAGAGGKAHALPAVAGLHTLAGLRNGVPSPIQFRVTASGGDPAWSPVHPVTPTRATPLRFAAWADGFYSAPLDEPMAAIGLVAATPEALNTPFRLAGGGELEYISGPNSLFVRRFAYNFVKEVLRPGETPEPGQRVIRELHHRHFEPAGRYADLAPLEARAEPFRLRRAGQEADEAGEVVVLGGCGAHGQPALSAVGLDAAGDPVVFRFDRLCLTGLSPDGVPWAVGPLRLLRNGGVPVEVSPGTVVQAGGAQLAVVEQPGQWPSRHHPRMLDLLSAYRSLLPPPDWTPTAAPEDGSELSVFAQFESLHLYLNSPTPEPAEVRFAKIGDERWCVARPLHFDPRSPPREPVNHAAVIPGQHRGVLVHLEPGTSYRIQVRQGARIWERIASTLSRQTSKVRTVVVGVVDGDLVIREGGEPGAHVEYRDALVRGGSVRVEASHVILRDFQVLGSPAHAVELADTVSDVRFVRGRIAGWGRSDKDDRPGNFGWARQLDSGIYCAPIEKTVTPHGISLLGVRFGSPRFPANTWEEYNPAHLTPESYGRSHPWGAQAVGLQGGIYAGGWSITDCSVQAHVLRAYNDGLGGNLNSGPGPGGFGPNFVFAHNHIEGAADDCLEHEGSCANGLILGNSFDSRVLRPDTRGAPAALALSSTYWGPTLVARNSFVRHSPEGWGASSPAAQNGVVLKIKRLGNSENRQGNDGRIFLFNNTAHAPSLALAFRTVCPSLDDWGGYLTGGNNLMLVKRPFTGGFPGPETEWSASNRTIGDWAAWPALVPGTPLPLPTAVGALAGADVVPNLTDGGPWAAAPGEGLVGLAHHPWSPPPIGR